MRQKTLMKKAVKYCGNQSKLARRMSVLRGKPVRAPHVSLWLSEKAPVKPETAYLLELATNGEVLRVDFCPKLFGDLQERSK